MKILCLNNVNLQACIVLIRLEFKQKDIYEKYDSFEHKRALCDH